MGRAKTVSSQVSPVTVSWPALHRAPDPTLETMLDGQIILLHGLFTAKTCESWQQFMAKLPFDPPRAPKRGEAKRDNHRFRVEDAEFASRLWEDTGLRDALAGLPEFEGAAGLSGNLRLYSYSPGQAFGRHYDDAARCPVTDLPTRWTLLIYVTGEQDGVTGGETAFYEPGGRDKPEIEHVARLTRGTALLHKHGADWCARAKSGQVDAASLPHEGRAVLYGTKLVLRSDVTFK